MISPEGLVSWDEALGSTSYEMRVMKDGWVYKTVTADASNTKVHQESMEVFGDAGKGPTGTEKDAEIKAQARTTKVENVLEYDLMGIVREAGNYRVEVVPLNGVNSMIRGGEGELWGSVADAGDGRIGNENGGHWKERCHQPTQVLAPMIVM